MRPIFTAKLSLVVLALLASCGGGGTGVGGASGAGGTASTTAQGGDGGVTGTGGIAASGGITGTGSGGIGSGGIDSGGIVSSGGGGTAGTGGTAGRGGASGTAGTGGTAGRGGASGTAGSCTCEPLLSGTLTGSYEGQAFTLTLGSAMNSENNSMIVFSDGAVDCGWRMSGWSPPGVSAVVWPNSLEVGSYSSIMVELFDNRGNDKGNGSNIGSSVKIAAASASSVAGRVQYSYTAADGQHYELSGDFEVVRCSVTVR